MAKRMPTRSALKPQERDHDSVLLRSAESLGRMIGSLQRQIDQISRHVSATDGAPSRAATKKSATKKTGAVAKRARKTSPSKGASRSR
jgi:hypothetical protein